MKKIIVGLVAIAAATGFAFADINLSFYNKLYEEDALVDHYDDDGTGDSDTKTDVPGLKETMYAEVTSDKVDAMVKATFALDDYDDKHFGLQGKLNDWYIEFRPFSILAFGMHTGIFSDGSLLPVYDDYLSAGNIGSEGFTVSITPIEALRIGVTTQFPFDGDYSNGAVNYLNGNEDDGEDENFNIGVGAIFTHDLFEATLSIQDILDGDERQIGAYLLAPGLFGVYEPLTVGAGFAHAESARNTFGDLISVGHIEGDVFYENLLSAYATIAFEKFSLSAEMLYTLGNDDNPDTTYGYDFYTGASISFGLVENLTATVTGKALIDTTSSSKGGAETMLFGEFAVDYDLNDNNTIGAAFDLGAYDKDWAIAVPVYWKYHF